MIALTILLGILVFFFTIDKIRDSKKKNDLENKIKDFESKVFIKEMPNYIKHYDNRYKYVYKIIDIRVLPQNPVFAPELCAVITGKAKNGATLNATIDKFIEASKAEYESNLRDELKF